MEAAQKTWAGQYHAAVADYYKTAIDARRPFITTVSPKIVSAVGIVADARAAAIINASSASVGITAVATSYASFEKARAARWSIFLDAETSAWITESKAIMDAWETAENEKADAAESAANAIASVAGMQWSTDEAAAFRAQEEAEANAALAAEHRDIDSGSVFDKAEADARKTATIAEVDAGKVVDDAIGDIHLQYVKDSWDTDGLYNTEETIATRDSALDRILIDTRFIKEAVDADVIKTKADVASRVSASTSGIGAKASLAIAVAKKRAEAGVARAQTFLQSVQNRTLEDFTDGIYSEGVISSAAFIALELISSGLDSTANFFVGWGDSLSFGIYTRIAGDDYLRYIDQNSTEFQAGQIVGAVHGLALGYFGNTACAVGWAARAAKGYQFASAAYGVGNSTYKLAIGEKLTVWDWLAFAPLAGGLLGKLRGPNCFTSDMELAVEVNDASSAKLAAIHSANSSEEMNLAWLIAGLGGVAFGALEIRRYLKQLAEEKERKECESFDNIFANKDLLNKLLQPVS